MNFHHVPVLLEACLDVLDVKPGGIYLDGTAGGGGHSLEIAKRLQGGRLICLDKDPQAVAAVSERLAVYPCARVIEADFAEIPRVLGEMGIDAVDGILLDLGVSSHQLDTPERGFSYRDDAPLDMRMSLSGPGAAELLNGASADELTDIFRRYGEERFAARIARGIVEARKAKPLSTTRELVDIIRAAIPAAARREGGHPAKRVFQAVRVCVNRELENLGICLEKAFDLLKPGGRFAIITFQSLEDRMVKRGFAKYTAGCTCPPDFPVCVCGKKPRGRLILKKPAVASPGELESNPRSKSARLRAIERIR
ncbi:MAG: 16S rRNA (cytosine(1402)-N(4))-methyltransferase RsmH [Oscillospiraceae bacterium]|nr:16S rRNA (cytosine(1402)-N(4))-methyltransferase RsmH [Oscillospiraceae bacterium]